MSHFQVRFYAWQNIAPLKGLLFPYSMVPGKNLVVVVSWLRYTVVKFTFRKIHCNLTHYTKQQGLSVAPHKVTISGWNSPEISNVARTFTDVGKNLGQCRKDFWIKSISAPGSCWVTIRLFLCLFMISIHLYCNWNLTIYIIILIRNGKVCLP